MEMKPLGSSSWIKLEGENFKEILQKEENDLIGTEDAAELLGMKVDRVRYLCRQNRIPSKTLSNKGQRIFSRKELLSLEKPL